MNCHNLGTTSPDVCRSGTGLSAPMQLGLEINAAEWGCPVARVSIDEKFQYQSS